MINLLKLAFIIPAYFLIGPLLGMLIARSRKAQRVVFCLMVIMPSLPIGKLTLMVDSIETYRGHTKGFEANWIEVLGLALITASVLNRTRRPGWRSLAPGTVVYIAWCVLSMLSVMQASDKILALMAAFKFMKAVIIFLAAFHFLRDENDLRWVLRTMSFGQIFYALLALKMRYMDGLWQIRGWFEHQNPMAMWSYMTGIPLLAAALYRNASSKDAALYFAGFSGSVLCVLLTVSRAGFGALAFGASLVLLLSWLRSPSTRNLYATVACVIGVVGISAFAMDSFRARLQEITRTSEAHEFDLRATLNKQTAAMLRDSAIGIGWNNLGVMNSRPNGNKYSAILEEWDRSRGFRINDKNYYANPLTESLYWLLLAETGYPGFIGFMLFIGFTLWHSIRCAWRFRDSFCGAFAGAQFVTLGICYMHGTVERILTQTKNMSFWLLMCGLIAAMEAVRQREARTLSSIKPKLTKRRALTGPMPVNITPATL